jgi:hypothetical protein
MFITYLSIYLSICLTITFAIYKKFMDTEKTTNFFNNFSYQEFYDSQTDLYFGVKQPTKDTNTQKPENVFKVGENIFDIKKQIFKQDLEQYIKTLYNHKYGIYDVLLYLLPEQYLKQNKNILALTEITDNIYDLVIMKIDDTYENCIKLTLKSKHLNDHIELYVYENSVPLENIKTYSYYVDCEEFKDFKNVSFFDFDGLVYNNTFTTINHKYEDTVMYRIIFDYDNLNCFAHNCIQDYGTGYELSESEIETINNIIIPETSLFQHYKTISNDVHEYKYKLEHNDIKFGNTNTYLYLIQENICNENYGYVREEFLTNVIVITQVVLPENLNWTRFNEDFVEQSKFGYHEGAKLEHQKLLSKIVYDVCSRTIQQ